MIKTKLFSLGMKGEPGIPLIGPKGTEGPSGEKGEKGNFNLIIYVGMVIFIMNKPIKNRTRIMNISKYFIY